jgi:F0F1-type ATP synthase gamma subunit
MPVPAHTNANKMHTVLIITSIEPLCGTLKRILIKKATERTLENVQGIGHIDVPCRAKVWALSRQ